MVQVLLLDSNARSSQACSSLLDWSQYGLELKALLLPTVEAMMDAVDPLSCSLILIGMGNPDFGMELCERIRRISRVPIILLGGRGDFPLMRRALALQVSDCIQHPVQARDLHDSLKALTKRLGLTAGPAAEDGASGEHGVSAAEPIIETVKQYVEQELHHNITLKKISALLHFNCAYLGQKFKCHVHMSFNEYLLQQRMEKAKALLEKTDMRIYEIAKRVGYTEIDWFYKKFKAYTGASANEYRKQLIDSA